MRDFIKVSPSLWRSKKFRSLTTSDAQLAYVYVLTNPHCNSAGCYDLPKLYACTDLGWPEKAYNKALDSLLIAGLILFDAAETTILITNWVAFNEPTNPKHAIGILTQLSQASSISLKRQRFQEYTALFHAKKYDQDAALRKATATLSEAYRKPILTETEMERETEMENEIRGDLDLDARNVRAALRDCAVEGASQAPLGTGAVHLIDALERRKRA
jgi:hypothetical protein